MRLHARGVSDCQKVMERSIRVGCADPRHGEFFASIWPTALQRFHILYADGTPRHIFGKGNGDRLQRVPLDGDAGFRWMNDLTVS